MHMNTVLRDIRRLERLPTVRHLDRTASQSSAGGILGRLDQLVCGLTGHDELMRFEPNRLSLHCSRCGYQSAGWEVRSPRVDPVRARGIIPSSARREEDVIALSRLSPVGGFRPSP
jgi:hypothetical protein